jgi:hypothetical protein
LSVLLRHELHQSADWLVIHPVQKLLEGNAVPLLDEHAHKVISKVFKFLVAHTANCSAGDAHKQSNASLWTRRSRIACFTMFSSPAALAAYNAFSQIVICSR